MIRYVAFALVAALALPLVAADTKPAVNTPKIVATINGEVITREQLDFLYSRMNAQMRAQYDQVGGKAAFLDNYLRKRLVIQEAIKRGFDRRKDVQADLEAAKEAALFDRYIREVIAARIVNDDEVRKHYDANPGLFGAPGRVKVRHINIMFDGAGPKLKAKAEALALIQSIRDELRAKFATLDANDREAAARLAQEDFATAAKKYSEDALAPNGGFIGWMSRGSLDSRFEEAAYKLEPGTMSDVVETRYGFHLIFLEDKEEARLKPFEQVRSEIREQLVTQKMSDVMEAVTKLSDDLRTAGKVTVHAENIQ